VKISVIIPVYNEDTTLQELLTRVRKAPFEKEIIVIDDGSTDRTPEILNSFEDGVIKVCSHPKNRGKGAAVRTGLAIASGDIVLIQDADLEYSPEDYPKLVTPILEGKADVVYGSRVLGNPDFYQMGLLRFAKTGYIQNPILLVGFFYGRRVVTWLTNVLFGSNLTDQPTCYKTFRRSVLQALDLSAEGFEFCSEVTGKVLKAGHEITEVPISYNPRSSSEGKKLTWGDGIYALYTLLKVRLSRK